MISHIFDALNHTRPDQIQMNVAYQFHQIPIFFAHNGFISILEKVPVTLVALIEIDHISRFGKFCTPHLDALPSSI